MRQKTLFIQSPRQISINLIPMYEFHINRNSRLKYKVTDALFESSGNVIFPNFGAVRELAHSINKIRGVSNQQDLIRAGKLNAMGLLDEINHFLVRYYDEKENPGVLTRAYKFVVEKFGEKDFHETLILFLTEFPPKAVYQDTSSIQEYFNGQTAGRSHKEIVLEELVMLFLANFNPAFKRFNELFDDTILKESSKYHPIIQALESFFANEKPFGPDNQPLIDALKKPMLIHPDDIEAQLGYFKEKWGIILSAKFLERIASSLEFSKEEEKFFWNLFNKFGGQPGVDTFVPEYKKGKRGARPEDFLYEELERFTPDIDWMPNVVILAKNIYVWLDQLSKKYQRPIKRLDEIPDEELDRLSRWNFNGLWLIGVWERSHASKKIKQLNGNLDAVSSAYSLYDYEIAWDIGGEGAFQNLNHRASQRGIRLAGDMVPNHMGIYSKWVIEHPEYFVQLDYPPYPNYSFNGHNLSEDPNIELRIEDGYWSKNDAAVVFQRVDRRNGDVKYFYHGNDGTSMPWNDTAQLNLLRADVREAIIQNIFHVARKFSIIRFDAAMTLAKKHFQRLWYPMPGTSGVPSRQDHGMDRSEFDEQFPKEFWREVVDRINSGMPHTLLLAEAFWLMEGYFVRTLGMHRVYNSAFMHMLMKEENEKFRSLIKNTIEFNPEILKRYVNFMSNPDEETAVAQFGNDDKYFGVATLMVTLPGLPMFAHGQIEGYTEKYGMEYQRAYYNEVPDEWLVRRHEYEIFPLMNKRYLFSQVNNFEFYDFLDDRGYVNENVFAYSNRAGNERALIFFHNKFEESNGYIKHSLQKVESEGGRIRSVTLSEALNIQNSSKIFYRFKERKSKLEYLVSGREITYHGWRVELKAFQYAVYSDFIELNDTEGTLAGVSQQLHGKGVENIDFLIRKAFLKPFHESVINTFAKYNSKEKNTFVERYNQSIYELGKYLDRKLDTEEVDQLLTRYSFATDVLIQKKNNTNIFSKHSLTSQTVLFYCFLRHIDSLLRKTDLVKNLFVELQLNNVFKDVFKNTHTNIDNGVQLFSLLLKHHQSIIGRKLTLPTIIEELLNDFDTANFLGVNQHNDIWYFNKEQFELFMIWIFTLKFIFEDWDDDQILSNELRLKQTGEKIDQVTLLSSRSGYQVEKLKELSFSTFNLDSNQKRIIKKGNSLKKKQKKGTVSKTKSSKVNKVTKRKPSR